MRGEGEKSRPFLIVHDRRTFVLENFSIRVDADHKFVTQSLRKKSESRCKYEERKQAHTRAWRMAL
jgi:hypothetical protein